MERRKEGTGVVKHSLLTRSVQCTWIKGLYFIYLFTHVFMYLIFFLLSLRTFFIAFRERERDGDIGGTGKLWQRI